MALSNISVPEIQSQIAPRQLHILFSSSGCTDAAIVRNLLPSLVSIPDCSVKAILDIGYGNADLISASSECLTIPNIIRAQTKSVQDTEKLEEEAADLCQWADILVLAPIDANNLAKMLHGGTDNLLLEILRSWNVSKKVLMVPGMSCLMWENPMTKKQLTKIRRKWNWVQVLPPILWTFEDGKKRIKSREVFFELTETVRNQVDLMNIGHGVQVSPTQKGVRYQKSSSTRRSTNFLPPELWTMILDASGDWELAKTLHIYTNLPPPPEWQQHASPKGPQNYMEQLEYTLLTGQLSDIKAFIAANSVPRWMSRLCIKLIMRFAMTSLLSYLESEHKHLFLSIFGSTFLPDKASSVFGRTEILDFWNTSPSFLTKNYTAEAVDGASRQGFVHVLEWWQKSGLKLLYTEAALEQASSQGHMDVLEWWHNLISHQPMEHDTTGSDSMTTASENHRRPLKSKPGKSICYATQAGNADVVRWWVESGIAFAHEDTVAKLASTHGHVNVLETWHELKGSKMIYDNQVLVGATKMGHVDVLEWWKQSGLRVEYKTCDVEEALEDGIEGRKGDEVRRWWARNGLNLGVGTSEWMKPKVL
ncbi:hypothetical protein AAFC00_004355 [Neodothiora populina]|uniref:Flavoprotein domain-containing protein n=1 Tax=Neodothiora populina TaxID=2781224 RepID=A0ABR3PJF5_9PEZI